MLNGWLDFHRAKSLKQIEGLDEEEVRRQAVPTSELSLLSLIKHVAYVERWWFQAFFSSEELDFPEDDFKVEPEDTIASVITLYQAETQKSREIVAAHSLDDLGINPETQQPFSVRFIIMHMLEETAQHNGQADMIREAIDGRKGQ